MLALWIATLLSSSVVSLQEVSATEAWIQLPDAGETTALAYVVVKNPTMYDVYVVKAASSDVAEEIELRNGESVVKDITVSAYGSRRMKPDGFHLALKELKRTLEDGDSIPLTLTTDGNVKLRVQAVVRKE